MTDICWRGCSALPSKRLSADAPAGVGGSHCTRRCIQRSTFPPLVADVDDSLAGILIGSVRDDAGFVLWIAVAEDHRRRCVGSLLVERFAVTNELRRMRRTVNDADEVATAFWSRQGGNHRATVAPGPARDLLLASVPVTQTEGNDKSWALRQIRSPRHLAPRSFAWFCTSANPRPLPIVKRSAQR